MAHTSLNRLVFSPAIMRRKLWVRKNSGFAGAGAKPFERLQRFFVECRRDFHYRKGFH
jgi:hypothetical protein